MGTNGEGSGGWRAAPARFAFYLSLAAGCLALIYWLRTVFLMACIALIGAVLLDAVASFGTRRLKIPRGAGIILSAALLVAAAAGALALLAVPVIQESTAFINTFKQKSVRAAVQIDAWKRENPWIGQFVPDLDPAASGQKKEVAPSASGVARTAIVTASSLVDGAANALAVFLLAIFLAWSPERWLRGVAELGPPESTGERRAIYCRIGAALRSYLFSYGIYIVAMGALWSLGLWLIGIDYFLVFGILGGLVEVAPYIGPFIGLIPPLVMALATDPGKAIYVLVLYAVLHIVEGYLLVPWLMHEREHLPPPLIILSLLAFGTLFGVLGVLLAVPLATTIYVIASETIYRPRKFAPHP